MFLTSSSSADGRISWFLSFLEGSSRLAAPIMPLHLQMQHFTGGMQGLSQQLALAMTGIKIKASSNPEKKRTLSSVYFKLSVEISVAFTDVLITSSFDTKGDPPEFKVSRFTLALLNMSFSDGLFSAKAVAPPLSSRV
jgi:hypothetical protein